METLWRCTTCGKWSHAKKRPKWHERFVPLSFGMPDSRLIIDEDFGDYDHINGTTREGGWTIQCGPFEQWSAVRVDSNE